MIGHLSSRSFRRAVAFVLTSAWLLTSGSAVADTFGQGSLVLPMDTDYQDQGMLKVYGLVYDLLRQSVPVRWVIKNGKLYQGVDFVASGKDHQTQAVIANHGYRGGPWVVDSADAAKALPIIDAWQANNPEVAVHEVTASFTADVAKLLVVAPRVAMHADGNEKIARSYLMAAGIPDSTLDPTWPITSPDMLTPAQVAGPTAQNHRDGKLFDADGDPVYCQFMSMHWGVKSALASPETVAEVRTFLTNPVHFFAECQGVNAFENLVPHGHFLTPNGFLVKQQPIAVDFHNFDSPFAQIDGAFATVGGSEPGYALPPGDKYKAGGVTMITKAGAPEGTYDLWMTGYLDGGCPPYAESCNGLGKVSYLAGHQYSTTVPMSQNPTSQGTRLFLNSLFDSTCASAAGLPAIIFVKSAPATTTQANVTFTLFVSNNGPSVALDAVLVDPLPAGASFVSATGGGIYANGKVTWNLANLGVGETQAFALTLQLGAFGTYQNAANLAYLVGLNPFTKASNTTSTLFDKDSDGDGILDPLDICPLDPNPSQDLATDIDNCGACGTKCAFANAFPACVNGACVLAGCAPGFSNCDGAPGNGCEVADASFASDPANCGGCGQVCAPAHAKGACANAACTVGACDPGYADCNALAADGCEYATANFANDAANCGGCGKACANGFVCSGGVCVADVCPAGQSDCNGLPGDGCEYANAGFASDLKNCGGCGLACGPAHATGACKAGVCAVASCALGFSNCNGLVGDGCEYADAGFQSDAANCGGCAIACAPAHAAGACAGGACTVGACLQGFSDCNGLAADGCEIDSAAFANDPMNCGGCGVACGPPHATGACNAGVCVVGVCDPGHVDLDGSPANGCEYACTPIAAVDSTCDGVDDDCDGAADEEWAPTTCGVGVCAATGACAGGAITCVPGAPAEEGPAGALACSNGVDDDCDGLVDAADPGCQQLACASAADCDDGNLCTVDDCALGLCSHAGFECDAGAGGAGGATGSGGAGAGGATGSGGAGAGGATGSGGSGAGGATSMGGAGIGGAGMAGSTSTGGAAGNGGATGAGNHGLGGTAGGVGTTESGTTTGGSDVSAAGDAGACACRVGRSRGEPSPFAAAIALAFAALARRRRRSVGARG